MRSLLIGGVRLLPFVLLPILLAMSAEDTGPWWVVQTSGVDTNLRGISVKYDEGSSGKQNYFVWASGSHGVILRSVDSGKNWKRIFVAGGEGLDFRDVEAFDERVAYVMSSGDGDKSRIYKTTDGGTTWKLQYSNRLPGFFLDALACDSATHCVGLSDPVGGKFLVLSTEDGEHWKELPREKMPEALPSEGAFAASGTAIALCKGGIYFGTGGPKARVFRSGDRGESWNVVETPMAGGNASSGIFSIACAESREGETLVAVGGDYQQPGNANRVAIYSRDGGATWRVPEKQPGGYRSAVGAFSFQDFAAVGPNGTDVSHDSGVSWVRTDGMNLNAVSFAGGEGWAVGAKGTIARFKNHYLYMVRGRKDQERFLSAQPDTFAGSERGGKSVGLLRSK